MLYEYVLVVYITYTCTCVRSILVMFKKEQTHADSHVGIPGDAIVSIKLISKYYVYKKRYIQ